MQLEALHIKDGCPLMIPNLMVVVSLHSMTTASRSNGMRIVYHNLLSALNDHRIKIKWYAHRLSRLSVFLNQ